MDDWKELCLEEVTDIAKGRVLPKSNIRSDSDVRYLGAADIEGGNSELYTQKQNAVLCSEEDVLMLWDGERSGLVGCGLSGAVGSTVARLRPFSNKIVSRYLYHHLRWRFKEIQALRTGTGIPHVPRDLDEFFQIPVPPLPEQKRIAAILDTLDQTIQATEHLITKRRKIREGLAQDLLKGPVKYTLAYHADINPESLGSDTQDDLRFDYLELSSVSNGSVISQLENMTFGAAPSRARRIALKGDFLFGTVRPVQKSHAWVPKDCIASTGFAVVRPKHGLADSRFLGHFLLTEEVTLLASRFAVGSGYPALAERDLGALQFPDLPLEQQKRIAAILDSADQAIQENETELAKLRKLRSGLASDLLSGRVRT